MATPSSRSRQGSTVDSSSADGVQIDALEPLDALTVQTRNSRYDVVVQCPSRREVDIRGGRYFPEFTRVRLRGSSLGGACLKLGGVYVGFLLELEYNGQRVVTTRVERVSGVSSVPAPTH